MQWGTSKQTAIYFFSSIKTGSGKSSIVSNLSIYLDSLSYKVAVLDLDYTAPNKLLDAFSRAVEVKEYNDLSILVPPNAPRFQAKEYFSETNKLSYFPALKLKNISEMMSDTSLRNFFIQLTTEFDYVLVNLPPGTKEAERVSDLISKTYLWRSCKPSSLIISLTDENSLISLDTFIQNNQLVSYQAEENTYFIFNKVPSTTDNQNINNEVFLNISDIRTLFTYPLTYVIPFIDEFIEQNTTYNLFVLLVQH